MANAKELRQHAAEAKRTAATIQRLGDWSALTSLIQPVAIGGEDQKILREAAAILKSHGDQVATLASQRAKEERQFEAARRALVPEAEQILASWPPPTAVDKVSMIIAAFGDVLSRTERPPDRATLDTWYEGATSLAITHATSDAVRLGKPCAALMDKLRTEIEQIRAEPETARLAQRWQPAVTA